MEETTTSDIVIRTPASRLGAGTTVQINGEAIDNVINVQISITPENLVKLAITQQVEDPSHRLSERTRTFTGQMSIMLYRALEIAKPNV